MTVSPKPPSLVLYMLLRGKSVPEPARGAFAKANSDIFDFALAAAEMAEIFALAQPDGRLVNPAGFAPNSDR